MKKSIQHDTFFFCLKMVSLVISLGLLGLATQAAEPVLDFTGSASYVNLGTPDALQLPAGPFTIEGWVRFDTFATARCFYSKCNARTSSTRRYDYMFGVGSGGATMRAYTGYLGSPQNTWRDVALSPALETGRWYHLAFSFDGTTLSYYLDGALQGTQPYSFGNNTAYAAALGGYANTTDIDGNTSDMRVWDHARSQADIQALMNQRLTGVEDGLAGYWPMNEGMGIEVYDATANATTGTIINASWTTDTDLALTPPPFLYSPSFTLADIETGSERFTNSNEVDIVNFPIPVGFDQFQITESGAVAELGAWTAIDAVPAHVVFSQPASDTNVTLYAWFTNSTESVTVRRSEGAIVYTTNAPVSAILGTFALNLVLGSYVIVRPEDVDDGSSGGETLGEAIDIHSWRMNLISGPDTDATPDEPYVTVAELGDYTLTLTITNEAGNVTTSAACVLSVTPFSSGQFSWSGFGDGTNWFDQENWLPIGQPGAGHVVRIDGGASVLLTNETPMLSELWLTNATLTVSNWNTAIRADTVTIDDGGVLTLPGPFTDTGMSNRVWIVCEDFTLAEGGTIDADGKGYDGGCGPSGAGTSERLSGAGYGGRGGVGSVEWGDARYGVSYGTVSGPLQPGSGGCGAETDGITRGGPGGGLVQIEATGTITIHGAIRADGLIGKSRRYYGPGGGSGGGVHLSCQTFTGSSIGSISVCGGAGVKESMSAHAGRGGGGRVVILYENASPWPAVTINADVGPSGSANETHGDSKTAQWGTLFVSDASLLAGMSDFNSATFAVSNVDLWMDGVTQWTVASMTVSNAAFRFGDTNLLLKVNGALVVDAGGRLGASRIEAGSVILTNGGILEVHAAATNAPGQWGGWLNVAGDVDIATNSILRLFADQENGGSPRVRAHNLRVAAGGLVDARAKGFASARGPGAGSVLTNRRGGGYGGQGGDGSSADPDGGLPYGSMIGPFFAGSGGCYEGRGGDGGGLVHIEAAGEIALHGAITVQGGLATDSYSTGQRAGGGSGGGVFLVCQTFSGSAGATISAVGGAGRTNAGGGGGGRIALWTGIHSQDFLKIWEHLLNGKCPASAIVKTNALPFTFTGVFEDAVLLGGGGPATRLGETGTFNWIRLPQGTFLMVR